MPVKSASSDERLIQRVQAERILDVVLQRED
jgi:hypothetical protein